MGQDSLVSQDRSLLIVQEQRDKVKIFLQDRQGWAGTGFWNFAMGQTWMGRNFDILPLDGMGRDFDILSHPVWDRHRTESEKSKKKNLKNFDFF